MLGPVVAPSSVHQSKFSIGTVLALIALKRRASLADFDEHFNAHDVVALRDKVVMELDAEVDRAYPVRWIGKVSVETSDGRRFDGRVDEPKGDPGNTLSRAELEDKALRLAAYRGAASEREMRELCRRAWTLADAPAVGPLLAPAS